MRKIYLLMLPLLFSLLGVLSVKADFTTKYKSSGYWTVFSDQVPTGLQAVIDRHVNGQAGHTTNYVTYPVEVSATGDITATVQFDSGGDRLEILGMDILNAEDAVVAYDYHYGYAGSNSENQSERVYTLSNVDAGSYTIRIFVCSNNSGHNVANSNGTITFAGNVTETAIPGNNAQVNTTHYFQIKSAAYDHFLVSDFTDNKPHSKSGTYNNTPNSLWAFEKVDGVSGKYYIRSCETGLYLTPTTVKNDQFTLTETKCAFDVITSADATAHEASKHYFRFNNNNDLCLHDPNWWHAGYPVLNWDNAAGASHWNIIETNISTTELCAVLTYNFTYGEDTKLSQTSSLWTGSEYPNYNVVFPYGYTPEKKPTGTVDQSGIVTIDIQLTKSEELPFKSYASASEIKTWYYVQMHGNTDSRGYLKDATENISYADKNQPTEVSNIHMWGFVGDAFGMKMVNKSTGKAIKSTGGATASLSSNIGEGTAFVVTGSRQQNKPWFCFKYPSNNNYLNAQHDQSLGDVVKHWADNDNGSSMLVSEADINVMVGETGYATFYSSSNVAIPAEVQAYVVSAASTSATLTPVTGVLPANTGVILKNAGEYAFKISTETPQSVETSLLSGSTVNTYYEEEAYVLSKVDGKVGLYKAQMDGGKWLNNANKAYLPARVVGAGARFLTFDFDDNAETGISAVEIEEVAPANAAIYDLSGRRVQSAKSGLYIINGKKVIK